MSFYTSIYQAVRIGHADEVKNQKFILDNSYWDLRPQLELV